MEEENSSVMNEKKEPNKFINFGKLYIKDYTCSSNSDTFIIEMKKDLGKKFLNSTKYIIDEIYDNSTGMIMKRDVKLEFNMLSSDDEHFFGSFSKYSNTKDVLTDIVSTSSNEKIDPDTIYFEHNTLFYIDYSNKSIAFIKTDHIKNVYPLLETFLNNNNFLNISIAPLVKKEEEINNSIINEFYISLANEKISSSQDFVSVKNLEKMGCKINNYKLKVSIKESNSNFINNLQTFLSNNKSYIKKMSVSTLNENIDLLTNRFTKTVPIKLSNNYSKDFSIIELTLKTELLKAIQ